MSRWKGQWDLSDRVTAPFTADEAASLNTYQASGTGHPFTCGNDECRGRLLARPDGWICGHCGYTQTWAWKWMANWAFLLKQGPWALHVLTGTREDTGA